MPQILALLILKYKLKFSFQNTLLIKNFKKIVTASACGSINQFPCAVFFTTSSISTEITTINSWSFDLTAGNNILILPQPVFVQQGSFIYLNQNTTQIAIDTAGNATYSDMYSSPLGIYYNLNLNTKWRFYLMPITNFSCYQSSFTIAHQYSGVGLQTITLTFQSSNQIFSFPIYTTQFDNTDLVFTNSNSTLDNTINFLMGFYSSYQNETVYIDYGDNTNTTIKLNGVNPSYNIPNSLTTFTYSNGSTFLSLNNQFMNQTILSGFQVNGAVSGTINIQVIF